MHLSLRQMGREGGTLICHDPWNVSWLHLCEVAGGCAVETVAWSIHRLDKRTLPLSHAEGHLFTNLPRRTTQTDFSASHWLLIELYIYLYIYRYIHKFVLIYRRTPVHLCDTIKERFVGYWCPLHTWNKTLGYYISYAGMGLPHYWGMLKRISFEEKLDKNGDSGVNVAIN